MIIETLTNIQSSLEGLVGVPVVRQNVEILYCVNRALESVIEEIRKEEDANGRSEAVETT